MPEFMHNWALATYGLVSLAKKAGATLAAAVDLHSNPSDAEHYNVRVHIFGRIAGILQPEDFCAIRSNICLDLLGLMLGAPKKIAQALSHVGKGASASSPKGATKGASTDHGFIAAKTAVKCTLAVAKMYGLPCEGLKDAIETASFTAPQETPVLRIFSHILKV
eukprot:SAG11_NODE_911_length_6582_cov_9.565633_4_plen_164_part_00